MTSEELTAIEARNALMKDERTGDWVIVRKDGSHVFVPGGAAFTYADRGSYGLVTDTGEVDEIVRVGEPSRKILFAARSIWNGEWCAQNQAKGNGPCGACAPCYRKQLAEARDALALAYRDLRSAAEWIDTNDGIDFNEATSVTHKTSLAAVRKALGL